MATPLDFAKALLNRLGLPQTKNRLVSIVAFAAQEGGHWGNPKARYNPWNTTRAAGGSHGWSGSVPIQVFPNWAAGIEGTALTVGQLNMRPILDALKSDADPKTFQHAVTSTPWCPQSAPGCSDYAARDPYALYNSYANKQDNGGSIADTGGPGVVGWIKDHPWITASVVLLSAGAAAYYFKPNLFSGFPSARRLLARENPVRTWRKEPGGEWEQTQGPSRRRGLHKSGRPLVRKALPEKTRNLNALISEARQIMNEYDDDYVLGHYFMWMKVKGQREILVGSGRSSDPAGAAAEIRKLPGVTSVWYNMD